MTHDAGPLDLRRYKAWLDCGTTIRWPTHEVAALIAEVERLRAEVDSQKFVINRQATLLAIATEQDAAEAS